MHILPSQSFCSLEVFQPKYCISHVPTRATSPSHLSIPNADQYSAALSSTFPKWSSRLRNRSKETGYVIIHSFVGQLHLSSEAQEVVVQPPPIRHFPLGVTCLGSSLPHNLGRTFHDSVSPAPGMLKYTHDPFEFYPLWLAKM